MWSIQTIYFLVILNICVADGPIVLGKDDIGILHVPSDDNKPENPKYAGVERILDEPEITTETIKEKEFVTQMPLYTKDMNTPNYDQQKTTKSFLVNLVSTQQPSEMVETTYKSNKTREKTYKSNKTRETTYESNKTRSKTVSTEPEITTETIKEKEFVTQISLFTKDMNTPNYDQQKTTKSFLENLVSTQQPSEMVETTYKSNKTREKTYESNKTRETTYESNKTRSKTVSTVAIPVIVLILVLIVGVGLCVFCIVKRNRNVSKRQNGHSDLRENNHQNDLEEDANPDYFVLEPVGQYESIGDIGSEVNTLSIQSIDQSEQLNNVYNTFELKDDVYNHTNTLEIKSLISDDYYQHLDIRVEKDCDENIYNNANTLGANELKNGENYHHMKIKSKQENTDEKNDGSVQSQT